jgi:hypothetical protein
MKLTQEQAEYLGEAINETSALVGRCIDLLKSRGVIAEAAWTDPRLTSTSEKHCLQITTGKGHSYGYGDTERLAAVDCFAHLWFMYVTVPSAPTPSEDEIALKASGKWSSALDHYMDRTGESLRIARLRLRI